MAAKTGHERQTVDAAPGKKQGARKEEGCHGVTAAAALFPSENQWPFCTAIVATTLISRYFYERAEIGHLAIFLDMGNNIVALLLV